MVQSNQCIACTALGLFFFLNVNNALMSPMFHVGVIEKRYLFCFQKPFLQSNGIVLIIIQLWSVCVCVCVCVRPYMCVCVCVCCMH